MQKNKDILFYSGYDFNFKRLIIGLTLNRFPKITNGSIRKNTNGIISNSKSCKFNTMNLPELYHYYRF